MKSKLQKLLTNRNFLACAFIFSILLAAYLVPVALGVSQNPIYHRAALSTITEPARLEGQGTIDPNDGFTAQALGRRAAMSWLEGDVPYWNTYEGLGTPLAGGMQSAAFFPLTILLRLHDGFIYIHFLLQLLAGVTMFLFLKRLKLRYSLAILGGTLFALNGAFAWLTNAPFNAIAFLPLLMLGVEYAVIRSEKNRPGGWLVIAAAISLSLYCGFPETAFLNALFAAGWGIVRMVQIDRDSKKRLFKKAIAGSVVGLLLSAPILVAFIAYLGVATTGGHEGGGYAYVGLSIRTLPALIMPYIFGPIFAVSDSGVGKDLMLFWSNVGGYLTAPLVFTAIVGIFSKGQRALKMYLFVFSLVVILKVFSFKPVAFLINLIPGMDMIAFYRYSIPALSFAFIVLAMFGANALIKAEISRAKVLKITAASLAIVIGLAIYARNLIIPQLPLHPAIKYEAIVSVLWALGMVGLMGGSIFLKPKRRLIVIVSVLIVDALVMFSVPYFSWPKTSQVDYEPVTFLQQNMGLSRFYTLGPIAPNYGSYFGVASINVNDLPVPKNWAHHIEEKLDHNSFALVFTGYSRLDPTGPTALEEFTKNLHEYENVGVKYIMTTKGQISDELAAQHKLRLAFSNATYALYELPNTKPFYEAPDCNLTNLTRTTVTADCAAETTLIRRELSLPGWVATVNKQQQAVGTKDDIFQTTPLPKGQSQIIFTYTPPYIIFGYILFAVGLGVTVIYAATTRRYIKK